MAELKYKKAVELAVQVIIMRQNQGVLLDYTFRRITDARGKVVVISYTINDGYCRKTNNGFQRLYDIVNQTLSAVVLVSNIPKHNVRVIICNNQFMLRAKGAHHISITDRISFLEV